MVDPCCIPSAVMKFFVVCASILVALVRSQDVDPVMFVESVVMDTNSSCTRLEHARLELVRSMHDDMLPDRYLRNVVGDRRWLWQSTLREAAAGVLMMTDQFAREAGCSPSFRGEALSRVQELSKEMLVDAIATQRRYHTQHKIVTF